MIQRASPLTEKAVQEEMSKFHQIGSSLLEGLARQSGPEREASAAIQHASRRDQKRKRARVSRPRSVNIQDLRELEESGEDAMAYPSLFEEIAAADPVVLEDTAALKGAKTVKEGPLIRLVEYLLCTPDDEAFEAIFLLNYRVFLTARTLFAMLRTAFMGSEEEARSIRLDVESLRERVLDIVGAWVSDYFFDDFAPNPKLTRALETFLSVDAPAGGMGEISSMLRELRDSLSYDMHVETVWPEKTPDPVLPPALESGRVLSKPLTIYDVKDVELARQLSLIESDIFHAIRRPELVGAPWMEGDEAAVKSPNVLEAISLFNRLYLWATLEVIKPFTKAERAKAYEKMVSFLSELYKIRNYNATMALVGALNSAPVLRLAHTRKLVSSKAKKILRKVEEAMSTERNYGKYRAVIGSTTQATVPYLWLTLHDLVLAKDGNASRSRENPDSLAMSRHIMTHMVASDIFRLQHMDYNFVAVAEIQAIFSNLKLMDEDALYKVSNNREPRGADVRDIP